MSHAKRLVECRMEEGVVIEPSLLPGASPTDKDRCWVPRGTSQINVFRVKLILVQTPPVATKTESARALATPNRGEFIGPPLPR